MISGEQITYTYDALNRLASAVTSDNPNVTQWGQSYNYDGFGNLTDQNLIKGTAPSMHVVYSAATNRQTGDSADYNGNLSSGYVYDIDNRLVQPGGGSTARYGYDANNKRVWRGDTSSGLDEIAFWAGNQKLCTYSAAGGSFTLLTTNVYFGAKLVSQGTKNVSSGQDRVQLAPVAQDRLGSMNGKFYPYGQERPSATTSDKEKFTGYFRDASTGLDYADQRYEQPGVGRFMTPDPYGGSAKVQNPGSWNRYAYTMGDPVNNADPSGLDLEFEPDLPSIGYFSFGFPWLGGGGGGGNWPKHSVELADVCDIQPRQCRLNAQGTAGRLIHVTNLSTTSSQALEVQNDLRWLREAIQADDTCNSWLSSGGTSASAGIDFMLGVGPGAAGMRVGVANLNDPTTGAIAGTGNTDMPLGSMSITVNTMGAFFNSTVPGSNNSTIQLLPPPGTNITPNTAVYQAFALLHELAHQLGANDFLDNDTSVARQTSNNQAVLEHCGSILSGLQ